MQTKTGYYPDIQEVEKAAKNLKGIVSNTPLLYNDNYSKLLGASVYFKREDLQQVRSYKIRGAYNKISSLSEKEKENGVVCASAGNHAQGVAITCNKLKIQGTIYMPAPTPNQKIAQVKMFGGDHIKVILTGDTFDDSYNVAISACQESGQAFIHPFDDEKIIEGQATVGLDILTQTEVPIDYVIVPIGGGGLAAGLSSIFKTLSPKTKIIGVEPEGAPSMKMALINNEPVTLDDIEKFVDGAAVKRVGTKTFALCKENLHKMITVPEGKVCQTLLDLYNKEAIVAEPAGALSISALDLIDEDLRGKNVVCVVSGSNNDIVRTAEIKERALLYANLKHYFIVRFPQRAGALKEFITDVLGPNDDITHFQYSQKHSKESGPAVVGIQLKTNEDFTPLVSRMKTLGFYGDYINDKPDLFQFLI